MVDLGTRLHTISNHIETSSAYVSATFRNPFHYKPVPKHAKPNPGVLPPVVAVYQILFFGDRENLHGKNEIAEDENESLLEAAVYYAKINFPLTTHTQETFVASFGSVPVLIRGPVHRKRFDQISKDIRINIQSPSVLGARVKMSDDDRDIDIESDDDNDSDTGTSMPQRNSTQNFTQEEKRAHHNALERKRRDHIKESFTNLREAVPSLKGEKASRAQILKKTTDCIQNMRRKIQANQKDVNDLKHQIAILEEEVRLLESAKNGSEIDASSYHQLINCDHSSDGDEQDFSRRSKKMKTSYQI
uniref:Protein max n=1 Tax=Glossina pallidipes TaxID=7398 RepID=A0A1A9Z516_GLOPL